MPYRKLSLLILLLPAFALSALAQGNTGNLYSAGHAGAFIGGLYDAGFTYADVLKHGDFGLGAPADLDGELMIFKGIAYKTQHTGKTSVLKSGTTPYAISCFFKPSKVLKPGRTLDKAALFKYLDSVILNSNGIYAIHLSGNFTYIKTRAFPPVQKPYKPLASLLNTQSFFEFKQIKGDLIGFKLPDFMEGPFIKGYHFHFLSDDKTSGGHIIDVVANNVTIEIQELDSYTMDLPQTESFRQFNFNKDMRGEISSVENGKKD